VDVDLTVRQLDYSEQAWRTQSVSEDAATTPTKLIEAERSGPARIPITGPKAILDIEHAGIDGLLPAWTFHECFRAAAALDPTKAANIFIPSILPETKLRTISFAEMIALIEQAANLFWSLSKDKQPVVSILAPLLPEALVAMWGAAIAGVANPINPFLDVSHVAGIMNAAQTNVLVTGTSAHGSGAWDHISTLASAVPTLRAILVIEPTNSTDRDFLTSVKKQSSDLIFAPDPNPDRVSGYFHTGGTTALPKLVRHTQRGQLLNAWISASHMGPARDEVVGHGMPNFHVGGAILLALRSLIMGQTLLTLTPHGFRDRGMVREFWNLARQYGITSLLSAPTTAAMMLADGAAKSFGHSIRTFTVGGGAMPHSLGKAFQERFDVPLREIWGMTECQGILSSNPWGDVSPKIGSVGLRNPFHRIIAVDVEEGLYKRHCELAEKGVLAIAGPCVTPGYLNLEGAASPLISGMPDAEKWVNSGDLGTIDSDGYIWLHGRQKDIIIRGGHNIDPSLVEEVLNRHPAVQIAAAVGQPDALKGELPIAYVQLRQGVTVTSDELLALCRKEVVERAAIPIEVIIIDEIPVTAVGKIFKPALRRDAILRIVLATIKRTLDNCEGISAEVADTKVGMCAVIRLPKQLDNCVERLRTEFSGFLFQIDIVVE
jgi:fatty-acyl-CoA synthase